MIHPTPWPRGLATASALATLAVVAGCAAGPYQASGGSLYNRDAQRQMQNQDLADRVRAALRSDPRVGGQGVFASNIARVLADRGHRISMAGREVVGTEMKRIERERTGGCCGACGAFLVGR